MQVRKTQRDSLPAAAALPAYGDRVGCPGRVPLRPPRYDVRLRAAAAPRRAAPRRAGVKRCGAGQMVLVRRDTRAATVVEDGREAVYATLATMDFTSERRRMSSLVLTPQVPPHSRAGGLQGW